VEKVLIVDDNSFNLKMTSKAIEDVCKPVAVPSGEMALKFLSNYRPSLVLLDLLMPGMDGFETFEKIKSNPETADLPVIFLTADTDENTIKRCMEAGAKGLAKKPIIKDELIDIIRPYIG